MQYKVFFTVIILLLVASAGCSGGNGINPVSPDTRAHAVDAHTSGMLPVGLWQFAADTHTGTMDIVQLRSAELSLNVLPFMEPPPLLNLTIDWDTLDIDGENSYIGVDVVLSHPFVTPEGIFRGFDVRGVVFGPELTNADGYTPLLRPKDFSGEAFGYVDGLLGAPHSVANYSRDENGYKYFCDGIDADEGMVDFFIDEGNLAGRGTFAEGESNTRHYDLDFAGGESDFFVFNYAILANYNWPAGDPPYVLDDFDISTANMAEAFCMSNSVVDNTLYHDGSEGGGEFSLDIEIWDWQGLESTEVTIESVTTGIIDPVGSLTFDAGMTSKSGVFHFVDVPGMPLTVGDVDISIIATDYSQTYGSSWFLDLLSTGNPLYNIPVYTRWYGSITVAEGSPVKQIIPVEGQINLSIVVDTYPYKPPADIAVNSYDGKPKIMYTQHIQAGGHNVYRFLPDYSAHDGNLINYSHVWSARGFDTTNGWTVGGHPYQPSGHPDYGGAVNLWGCMNESGSYPKGVYWASDLPHMEIMDAYETDDTLHADRLWAVFDATFDGGGMRFYYHRTDITDPSPGVAYAACFMFNQLGLPGNQGIVAPDVKAMDALRDQYMFTFLEGNDIELWYIQDGANLAYGGLTISGFVDALDVSVDSDDYIWVLDQPNGNPRLQAFDSTDGTLIATSGEITTPISGTALKIDLDESDDECHLLHTDGVTVFEIDWS